MEDKNYSDLIEFIANKFDKVDQRLDSFVGQFDIVHKEIAGLNFKFDDLKKDFRQLQSAVDAYATQANTYFYGDGGIRK